MNTAAADTGDNNCNESSNSNTSNHHHHHHHHHQQWRSSTVACRFGNVCADTDLVLTEETIRNGKSSSSSSQQCNGVICVPKDGWYGFCFGYSSQQRHCNNAEIKGKRNYVPRVNDYSRNETNDVRRWKLCIETTEENRYYIDHNNTGTSSDVKTIKVDDVIEPKISSSLLLVQRMASENDVQRYYFNVPFLSCSTDNSSQIRKDKNESLMNSNVGKLLYIPKGSKVTVIEEHPIADNVTGSDIFKNSNDSISNESANGKTAISFNSKVVADGIRGVDNNNHNNTPCEWFLIYNHHHRACNNNNETTLKKKKQNHDIAVDDCNDKQNSTTILGDHNTNIPRVSDSKKSYICAMCIRSFVSVRAVESHIKSSHNRDSSKNNNCKEDPTFENQNINNSNRRITELTVDHHDDYNRSNNNNVGQINRTNKKMKISTNAGSNHAKEDDDEDNDTSYLRSIWTKPLVVVFQDQHMAIIDKPQCMAVMGGKPSLLRSDLLLALSGRVEQNTCNGTKSCSVSIQTVPKKDGSDHYDNDDATKNTTSKDETFSMTEYVAKNNSNYPTINNTVHVAVDDIDDSNNDKADDDDICSTDALDDTKNTQVGGVTNDDTIDIGYDDIFVFTKPRPVHRLDAATGGLLVLAKTRNAESYLRNAFAERTIHKRYRALVLGKVVINQQCNEFVSLDVVSNNDCTVDIANNFVDDASNPIHCTDKKGTSQYSHNDNDPIASSTDEGMIESPIKGKASKTVYKIVQYIRSVRTKDQYMTLVDLWPITGRKHQLRRHLQLIGHPIVGDKRYNGIVVYGNDNNSCVGAWSEKTNDDNITNTFRRLCLWAVEITMPHPVTNNVHTYRIDDNPLWLDHVMTNEYERWHNASKKIQ